jgi:hypothetical protein
VTSSRQPLQYSIFDELGCTVFAELLGAEAERMEGDDRRHMQTTEDRAGMT